MSRLTGLRISVLLMTLASCRIHAANGSNDNKDPHRPACTTARCEKIEGFLKKHYCGKPIGNGPDNSCDLREEKKPIPSTKITADYQCKWNEASGKSDCKQESVPSEDIRTILLREMSRIGLPLRGEEEVHYTVLESNSGWVLMMANYEHVTDSNVVVCQVIATRKNKQVHVLRTLPLRTTDADVPEVTRWFPVDIADVDGDGHMEAVLQGDEYENHWLEVISLDDGSFKTMFSGLGYNL